MSLGNVFLTGGLLRMAPGRGISRLWGDPAGLMILGILATALVATLHWRVEVNIGPTELLRTKPVIHDPPAAL